MQQKKERLFILLFIQLIGEFILREAGLEIEGRCFKTRGRNISCQSGINMEI